jgi:type VI secretion system protein VasG
VLIGFIEQHVLPKLSALWLDAFGAKHTLARIAIGVSDAAVAPAYALTFEATRLPSLHSDEPAH